MSPADVDRINGLNRQLDRDLQHMGQRKDKVEQEVEVLLVDQEVIDQEVLVDQAVIIGQDHPLEEEVEEMK